MAQNSAKSVDWREILERAQKEIAQNPSSAFWHNQLGVAYQALGDYTNAEKEFKAAPLLSPANPIYDYTLFAFYQRRGTLGQQEQALVAALGKESRNPLGHFELGDVLEKERNWSRSLGEYQMARLLLTGVSGHEYTDPMGQPYDIEQVRANVDKAIERVSKLEVAEKKKQ